MKRIKLVKGLSYSMRNVSCKKGEPFCVTDEQAEKLLSTGRFEMLEAIEEKPKIDGSKKPDESPSPISEKTGNPQNVDPDGNKKPDETNTQELSAELIDKMKKDDLVALASEKGIDIKACNNNDERVEKIKEALGFVNPGALEFEE